MTPTKENTYSSEINDVMKEPPSWMMNWGILTMLAMFLLLSIGAYLFKYPDIIMANVTITTANPPLSMVGKVNAKIKRIFVKNGQRVKRNEVLVLLETPADYEDIRNLKSDLKPIANWLLYGEVPVHINLKKNLSLGTIQEYYSAFLEDYGYYQILAKSNYFSDKIASRKKQLMFYGLNYKSIVAQNTTFQKDLELTKKQTGRDSALYVSSVISESDFDNSNGAYLRKLYSYQIAETNLSNLSIRIEEIKDEIRELEENRKVKLEELQRSLQKKLTNLLSQISLWEDLYVIKSPIEGNASLTKFYTEGLNAQVGEIVISVIPKDSTALLVRAEAAMKNAGKLKEGLNVNIKLENYNYMEYGLLKGSVIEISKLSENKAYYLNIQLEKGLETTLKKKLKLSQRMSGKAEIITEDKRLIERISDPILSLLRQ